jgi:hypothetical protein
MGAPLLKHFRCQRDDAHEVALAQLAGDRSKDTCAARLQTIGNHYGGVLVEAQRRAVGATIGCLVRTTTAFTMSLFLTGIQRAI